MNEDTGQITHEQPFWPKNEGNQDWKMGSKFYTSTDE